MISPIEIMSISAVNMMKGIAAARSRRGERSLKRDCVTEAGPWTGSGKRILNEASRNNLQVADVILKWLGENAK